MAPTICRLCAAVRLRHGIYFFRIGFYMAEVKTPKPCCGERQAEAEVIYLIHVQDRNGKWHKIKYRVSGNW